MKTPALSRCNTQSQFVTGHIISSIQQWSATQDDDLTVLVCDYTA
jgi:hypothetical protein